MIKETNFGPYKAFTLSTDALSVTVTELGATALSTLFDGREMLLGYSAPEEYLSGTAYLGAAVGRYANRIGGARFSFRGREYPLTVNENGNQLHGGDEGLSWSKRRWTGEIVDENAVKFTLFSPDGDNGYPGDMTASVTYRVEGAALTLLFEGDSAADTVYAPTSHMYFNLDGRENILTALMQINASRWVEVDGELIPTGRLLPAEGEFDFKDLRPFVRNYDHTFVLDGESACRLVCGGTEMEIRTDFPAVQVYTSEFLGAPHGVNRGVAIEPEFYPDSPNQPAFPSTELKAGEHFSRRAVYSFYKN